MVFLKLLLIWEVSNQMTDLQIANYPEPVATGIVDSIGG